ncbi:hypothetical protein ANTRET_LOCUS4503 [Anthophora retusa]
MRRSRRGFPLEWGGSRGSTRGFPFLLILEGRFWSKRAYFSNFFFFCKKKPKKRNFSSNSLLELFTESKVDPTIDGSVLPTDQPWSP